MLERNVSERYESRFVSVRVQRSASMMLRGMHDSVLGVWVAHGEGGLLQYLLFILSPHSSFSHSLSISYKNNFSHVLSWAFIERN